MASEPETITPYTEFIMTPDPAAIPLSTTPTMTPDPAAIPLPTTAVTTPDIVMKPPTQASFASLPREIRDKIYCLAVPHSYEMKLLFRDQPTTCFAYNILSPLASSSTYANEACAMFFKRNKLLFSIEDLQVLLGKDGIGYVCNFMGSKDFVKVFVIPKGSFEAKPWLRHIIISIGMKNKVDELAGRVGLLLECPALRRVEVVLHGGRSVLKCAIETISGAFKALAEKLGRRLMFSLAAQLKDDYPGSYYTHERFIGDLEKLETVAHDEDWISEDENLEIEGE